MRQKRGFSVRTLRPPVRTRALYSQFSQLN